MKFRKILEVGSQKSMKIAAEMCECVGINNMPQNR